MTPIVCPTINATNQVKPLERSAPAQVGRQRRSFAAEVQACSLHPWGLTDYHLYLATIERGQDWQTRIGNFMLLEGNRFRQIWLDELADSKSFAFAPMKTRLVAFALLPLLPHRASELPTRQSLVLGFDLRNHRIQAYFFECCPEGIADLGSAWEEGQLIIDVHVDRFLEMYVFVCTVDLDILSTGLFNYFRETTRELPVGLDLVVVIKFAELLSDIAHLIWDDPQPYRDSHHGSDFKLRDLLRKTSFDALVAAVRQNQTCEAYSQQRDGKPILTRQLILDESPASEPSPVEQVPAVHVQVQQPQAVKGATPRAPVWAQSSCAYSMLQMVSQLTQ